MRVTRDEVIGQRDALPAFPRVIDDILQTLDDPDANLNLLVGHVGRDPVLSGKIFAQANAAAGATRRNSTVRDLYTATSLLGLTRLRQTAIIASVAGFLRGALPLREAAGFWSHSAAVGVAAQQVALLARQQADVALIGGLLHDVGQLWLLRFRADDFLPVRQESLRGGVGIEVTEREAFGADHAEIGAWLAEAWSLPAPVVAAIRHHHAPDAGLPQPLVAVVHVAEVLANALDVTDSDAARVITLSAKACDQLGLHWDASAESLFGRIDAVSHHVATYFAT